MDYLFDKFIKISREVRNNHTFFFLDYDGTLSAIADTPQEAVLCRETKNILYNLSKLPESTIAIITGRPLDNIKKMVGLRRLIYAANHGLEIEGPKIKFKPAVSPRYRTVITKIKDDLINRYSSTQGALVEDKGLSLSLHYRLVNKKQITRLKKIFHDAVIDYKLKSQIKISPGKKVLEVRPPIEWDKGKVVLWLLARLKFILKNKKILPIYIGDDYADEDAFYDLRKIGITIFVGRPKASNAKYYLKDTNEVKEFLKKILDIKSRDCACKN